MPKNLATPSWYWGGTVHAMVPTEYNGQSDTGVVTMSGGMLRGLERSCQKPVDYIYNA